MVGIHLIQRDRTAGRQRRVGQAVIVARQHQSGQVLGNHGTQLHDVSAGGHDEHAIVVIAIVLADHREIRQLDRAVLRVHGELHIPNHGIRLDDDVAVAHLDVGVRIQLLAADQILEDDVSAGDDVQGLLRRADGAGRTGDQRYVPIRSDVRSRLSVRSAVHKASGLIGHGDNHLAARQRAERIAHPGNLNQLLRAAALARQDDASVGAHADTVGQRVGQNAFLGFDGQPCLSAIGDQRLASAGDLGRRHPIAAIEVPVPSLNIRGHHVGQAFQHHVLLLLQDELRLNLLIGAAVEIDLRVHVGNLHVAGLVRAAVVDRVELAGAVGVRVHEHQHPAGCGDVQIIVDAIALSGDVIVRRQLGLLDLNVADRAVELGVADQLRIGVVAFVGVRLVESDGIAGILVIRIGRLDQQRCRPRVGIGNLDAVISDLNHVPAHKVADIAAAFNVAVHNAAQFTIGQGFVGTDRIAACEEHVLIKDDRDVTIVGGHIRQNYTRLHIIDTQVVIDCFVRFNGQLHRSLDSPISYRNILVAIPCLFRDIIQSGKAGNPQKVLYSNPFGFVNRIASIQHRSTDKILRQFIRPSICQIAFVLLELIGNTFVNKEDGILIPVPDRFQPVSAAAGLFLRLVLAADDVRLDRAIRHHKQVSFGIRVRIDDIGRHAAIRHPVIGRTVFRLPLRQAHDRQLRLIAFWLVGICLLIGVGELNLTGAGADIAHQPLRIDDGQQRFKRRALVKRQLAGGQVQRHAIAQADGHHTAVFVIGEAVLVERRRDFDAIHLLNDAHDLSVRRHIHLRAVGQQVNVHVIHDAVALQIAVEARGIEGCVCGQFLHHAGEIRQRSRQRHRHHDGVLQAVQPDALVKQQIVHTFREQGFHPHRRRKRLAAAGFRQGIDQLELHRRQLHAAVAGRLRVHHALHAILLEHEHPEADALVLVDGVDGADAGGVHDVQRAGPYGRRLGRLCVDQDDAVHRSQVSAGFARPAEGRVAIAVGNQAAHIHIARSPVFHTDGGRGHGAVLDFVLVGIRTVHLGVDEVDVLNGDSLDGELPVGAVDDRHLGDEPLVVHRVAGERMLAKRQRAGQRIGQSPDDNLRCACAEQRHVFLRQADLTDAAAIGNIDHHAGRRIADVEARAGGNGHGTAAGQRTTAVRVAAGNTGPAGMGVLLDGSAEHNRVDPDSGAIDVHACSDGRRGGAGAVLVVVLAALVQPGLRIRLADALSKGVRIIVDVGRAVRRRRIRQNRHIVIALDRRVGDGHGIDQGCQRAAARLHVDAQAAAAGVGFHVEVQAAETALNIHVPSDDLGLARAGPADVHRGRQRERTKRPRVRLVADAGVVDPGVAVHIVRRGVGDDRHVSEGVLQQRASCDIHARIGVHIRIGACVADRHEGGVVHARLGVHIIAASADRLHVQAAKVGLEARAAADGDLDRAIQRIVGLHIAVRDESALGGAPCERVHRCVGERLHPDAAAGEQRSRANASLRRRVHLIAAIRRLDADRHSDAGVMRLGFRAGVILGQDVNIARRDDLTGFFDARVRVVVAVRRQRGALDFTNREAAALLDDGLRIARVVGIQLHIACRTDRRAASHVDLRILAGRRGIAVIPDTGLGIGAGCVHKAARTARLRRGHRTGIIARLHIQIADGDDDVRAIHIGLCGIHRVALRMQVAERDQAERAAVLRERLRQIHGPGKQGHFIGRQGQRFGVVRGSDAVRVDEHAVPAGAARVGVVDVGSDALDRSRRSAHRRLCAVALSASRNLVQLGLNRQAALHAGAAGAEEIGVLHGRQIGLHPVDGGGIAADGEVMRAHLRNGVGGGVHRDGHIAMDGQAAIASEAGIAGHAGLCVRHVEGSVFDVCTQAARRSGLRKAVHHVGGIHRHGAGAAHALAHLDRRGERAGSVRINLHQADVDVGYAAGGHVDARIRIGPRVGQHIHMTGDDQSGAIDLGGGCRRDGRVRRAGFAADERHLGAAAGAHLRGRRVIVIRAVRIELRLDSHASGLDRRALDLRPLVARNLRGDDVDRHVHNAGREVLALNVRLRPGRALHGDGHRTAAGVNAAASVDAGVGGHIRFSIGNISLDGDGFEPDALAGLRGNRIGIRRIGIADGNARGIHIAGNQGVKVALRIGIQGIDADAEGAGREVRAVDPRVSKGVSDDLDAERAVDLQRCPDDLGVVGGLRRGDRHIRLCVDTGERGAVLAAVGAQNGVRAFGLILVQMRGDRDTSRLQRERLNIRLLACVQRRGHGIGRHIGQSGIYVGLVHRRFRLRHAGRRDLHRARAHCARAGEVRVDPGRILRNRDVHLDVVVLCNVHAADGGRQVRPDQAGGVRLHGHLASLHLPLTGSVVRHDHECVKAALPIGVCRAERSGSRADSAHVADFRQHIGIAPGQNVDADGRIRVRRIQGRRIQTRVGLGARISHGDIDAHVDQRAAAGIQLSLRALRSGVIRVEVGLRRDATSDHVAACQRRLLTGAKHRRDKRRVHVDAADAHAADRRVGRCDAVRHDLQAACRLQSAAANDVREVPRIVVRDGGIHAHGNRARCARDRVRSRLSLVDRILRSRVDADRRRGNLSALGVNQGLVAGTQMDVAHGEADVRRADRRREQLRFGDGLMDGLNGDCFAGLHIRTADSGNGIRPVEDQKRVSVHRDSTARHRQDGRNGRAGGVVFHRDGIRIHAALVRRSCTGSLLMTVGRRADVGQDFRRNHCHRRGHVGRSAAEGHAQDIRPGVGVHIRSDIERAIGIQRHALTDERIHAAAVDHHGNRTVRANAARSESTGAAHGIRVLNRLDRHAVGVPDICVACDRGFHRAVKHRCGHGSANARDPARCRQRRGQHERIVHDGLDSQRLGLRNIAFHTGENIGVDVDRANRRGHARDGAGARDGDRPDGAGRQIDRVLSLERILQGFDALGIRIAHRRGARPRGNLDRPLFFGQGIFCGQNRAVLHLREHIGVQHRNRDARTHAGKRAGGDGAGNHVVDQVVIGSHLNIARGGHRGPAADDRADGVLRIIARPGRAQIPRSRDVRVPGFVNLEALAAGILARAARCIEFIAAIPVLRVEGMLRPSVSRLRAAHGDVGLTGAIPLEQNAQVVLAIPLRGAVTGREGLVHEGIRIEAAADALIVGFLLLIGELFILFPGQGVVADQRVARILRQLAARNGHHDRRANADLACRDRARIGIDVALRGGADGDRARQAFDHVVLAEARGDRVVDHVDHSRDANAHHTAARKRRCDRVGGQRVPGVNGDGVRFDLRAVVCHGLRGLAEHRHVHRAGHAGRAADGDARGVGREELTGIGRHGEGSACNDVSAAADDGTGRAFIIGNNAHRRNTRGAAAGRRAGDIEQLVLRGSLDRGIAGRINLAAHARHDVIPEHQRARANRNACRAAAREVQRQHQNIVIRNRGDRHVSGGAHKLHRVNDSLAAGVQAHAQDRFNRLVIDHDDRGSAHARRAAHGSAAGDVDYV